MDEKDLNSLDNDELFELLATLDGLYSSLDDIEMNLKERCDENGD